MHCNLLDIKFFVFWEPRKEWHCLSGRVVIVFSVRSAAPDVRFDN